jgi:hypothetical protein
VLISGEMIMEFAVEFLFAEIMLKGTLVASCPVDNTIPGRFPDPVPI